MPSIREWLTRKQKETRRGRAELRLVERSSLWNDKPENRHLPSVREWTNIRLLTNKKDWTESQRKMMRRAGWVHGLQDAGVGGPDRPDHLGRVRGLRLHSRPGSGTPSRLPARRRFQTSSRNSSGYYRWARRPLSDLLSSTEEQSSPHHLHASLALLPVDPARSNTSITGC